MGGSTKTKSTQKTDAKSTDTTNQTTTQVTGPSALTAPYYDEAYKGAQSAYAATPKTAEGIYAGPTAAQTGALDMLKNWATGAHPETANVSGGIDTLKAGGQPFGLDSLYAGPNSTQLGANDALKNWATGPMPGTDAVTKSLGDLQAGGAVRPSADLYAGPNATQLGAVQGLKDWAAGPNAAATNIQSAIGHVNQGYQPLDVSGAINAAINPYYQRLTEQILPGSRSKSISEGAFDSGGTGGRQDINNGQLIRDYWSSPVADIAAKYTLDEQQRQRQYGLDAAPTMTNLSSALTDAQLKPLGVAGAAGGQEQAWKQGELDALNTEKTRAANYNLSASPQIAQLSQLLPQLQMLPIEAMNQAGGQQQGWEQGAKDAAVGERDKMNAYNLAAQPQIAELSKLLPQLSMLPASILGQAGGQEQTWLQQLLDAQQRAPWNGLGEYTSILQALPGTQTTGVQAGTNTGTQVGTNIGTQQTKTPLANDIFKGLLGGAMMFAGA